MYIKDLAFFGGQAFSTQSERIRKLLKPLISYGTGAGNTVYRTKVAGKSLSSKKSRFFFGHVHCTVNRV